MWCNWLSQWTLNTLFFLVIPRSLVRIQLERFTFFIYTYIHTHTHIQYKLISSRSSVGRAGDCNVICSNPSVAGSNLAGERDIIYNSNNNIYYYFVIWIQWVSNPSIRIYISNALYIYTYIFSDEQAHMILS